MLLLVSFIASLVHIYSTRYMQGDAYLHRYWAFLGLFCFSMLALVVTDNLFVMYAFWELVGFSSYRLIGFWFTKQAAVKANKKAFIMNRLGDLGFLSALMIIYSQFQTFEIVALFGESGLVSSASIENGFWISGAQTMPQIWLTIAGLAFFFGAAAKSAQFPLHTWLPDAMEGPTSVSSLIHAATMVAAGVFLVARVYPIFDNSALMVIAAMGAFTAFMAASIALVQNDIKRILAYSTISQLGFMMLAMGVGAYSSGIFHLTTHAFFKCLLFLAAGAVIHEMHHLKHKLQLNFDHQDIRNMGGLRKHMPVTFITMLLASLALAGVPFTSGFLSKDAILIQTFEWADSQNGMPKLIPYIALITSWLTAFYIARLIFQVFFGPIRLEGIFNLKVTMHEAPNEMKYVLIVLALFCLFPVFSLNPFSYNEAWIAKVIPAKGTVQQLSHYHTVIPVLVSVVSLLLIFVAYKLYTKSDKLPNSSSNVVHRFLANGWYVDHVYKIVFVNGTVSISKVAYVIDKAVVDGAVNLSGKFVRGVAVLSSRTDRYVIDGFVNATASIAKTIGNFARRFQTGRLQHYLLVMIIMVLAFILIKYISQTI